MLHSYQKMYLSKAQAVLGETFDYAINTCKIPGESFIKQFVVSSVSKRMENGEPAYLVGKSGIEIAADIVAETTGKELTEKPTDRFERSIEYWIGWTIDSSITPFRVSVNIIIPHCEKVVTKIP